jgi:hypothetical protein
MGEIDGPGNSGAGQVQTEIENLTAQIETADSLAGKGIRRGATPQAIEYFILFQHNVPPGGRP